MSLHVLHNTWLKFKLHHCFHHRLAILPSGPPSAPTLSCVDVSEDVSGAVNVTVSWTLSVDSADFYLISITTNAPQTPYGGLLNITTASVTQHKLTGFVTDYEYNITIRGVNCGSQEGRESAPLIIGKYKTEHCVIGVCNVYYYMCYLTALECLRNNYL